VIEGAIVSSEEKVELASSAWLELAEAYLREQIPALGAAVEGVRFSMCESFTSAPAHIADEQGRAAWWFEIDGPSVKVGRGARDDVDVRGDVDYEQTLPNARLVYDLTDPTVVAMLEARAEERRASGATSAFDALPAEVRSCLTGLHNFLAPWTA
jgi:hypothetical protein